MARMQCAATDPNCGNAMALKWLRRLVPSPSLPVTVQMVKTPEPEIVAKAALGFIAIEESRKGD